MHIQHSFSAGTELSKAKKVLIMIHGRGGSAEDMLSLAQSLHVEDYALLAPQATHNTWYPYSFMMSPSRNEPWLSSALKILKDVVDGVIKEGIDMENIYFTGFSQGACLTLEFLARNAAKWGGAAAFSGGLIGDKIYMENYQGNFNKTPIFISSSNPDPHIPLERVYTTIDILKDMQADVSEKIYDNKGHFISQDEIDRANRIIFI
ncbi:alpha/beta hydrolase [Albibacterium bauzanense]|uniref:Phospholipase/carboxylesterase n=1 Tax=Albibacterium bauzanense TaxID=653929 RepID=A0A4R1LP15_9SPHI|nr:dienelactone hydrolase family protein [Albibacterium bauzanense]TCK80808.1 phospholipase/carboxylesterase [Albibacterium bauzanense]